MTAGRVLLDDRDVPSAGYRHAALAALIEFYSLPGNPPLSAVVPAAPDPSDDVHDLQHVTPEGQAAPNGVVWLERAGATVLRDAAATFASLELGQGETLHARVHWHDTIRFSVATDRPSGAKAAFTLDPYGRPTLDHDAGLAALLGPVRSLQRPVDGPLRKIAILADPHRATTIYPAVPAALGDAADAAGCRLSIEVVPPPADPAAAGDLERWREFDGVVLPGGADMDRTAALVEAAAACRAADIPTLGLCLGMQAMCIAAARQVPQLRGAAMEETDPQAAALLFTRLPKSDGRPWRRLGDYGVTAASQSRLAKSLGEIGAATAWAERMNHSFRFEPSLLSPFAASGLSVISMDAEIEAVDLIEDPTKTFYAGSQGHPELTSRRGAPHPMIQSFLWSMRPTGAAGIRGGGEPVGADSV